MARQVSNLHTNIVSMPIIPITVKSGIVLFVRKTYFLVSKKNVYIQANNISVLITY